MMIDVVAVARVLGLGDLEEDRRERHEAEYAERQRRVGIYAARVSRLGCIGDFAEALAWGETVEALEVVAAQAVEVPPCWRCQKRRASQRVDDGLCASCREIAGRRRRREEVQRGC